MKILKAFFAIFTLLIMSQSVLAHHGTRTHASAIPPSATTYAWTAFTQQAGASKATGTDTIQPFEPVCIGSGDACAFLLSFTPTEFLTSAAATVDTVHEATLEVNLPADFEWMDAKSASLDYYVGIGLATVEGPKGVAIVPQEDDGDLPAGFNGGDVLVILPDIDGMAGPELPCPAISAKITSAETDGNGALDSGDTINIVVTLDCTGVVVGLSGLLAFYTIDGTGTITASSIIAVGAALGISMTINDADFNPAVGAYWGCGTWSDGEQEAMMAAFNPTGPSWSVLTKDGDAVVDPDDEFTDCKPSDADIAGLTGILTDVTGELETVLTQIDLDPFPLSSVCTDTSIGTTATEANGNAIDCDSLTGDCVAVGHQIIGANVLATATGFDSACTLSYSDNLDSAVSVIRDTATDVDWATPGIAAISVDLAAGTPPGDAQFTRFNPLTGATFSSYALPSATAASSESLDSLGTDDYLLYAFRTAGGPYYMRIYSGNPIIGEFVLTTTYDNPFSIKWFSTTIFDVWNTGGSGDSQLYSFSAQDVPEFSLTTMLLAVLISGFVLMFVIRRRK